ncbi:MAG: patatin-like phospholipase family protein, partial [Alphaproteobacteria bacterium]|nr:patatin-like phospholipase family protein [Alphaproteobacteria bacterium]
MTSQQAQVQTFFAFPSGGVRGFISMFVASYLEKLSGVPIYQLSDINVGVSVGMIAAAAYSREEAMERPVAKQVMDDTFVVMHQMFSRDSKTVALKNIMRALPLIKQHAPAHRTLQSLLRWAESYQPKPEEGKYDPSILETAITTHFKDRKLTDLKKPFFSAAYCITDGKPHVFTNVDIGTLAHPPHLALHLQNVDTHGDVKVVDAIMAGTAIPGFIDFREIPGIGHFMDPGSFAMDNFYYAMRDMNIAAYHRARTAHDEKLSARSVFQRIAMRAPAPPSAVASRVVYFGVGDDANLDFSLDAPHGLTPQIPAVFTALGNQGRLGTFNQITTRFDKVSRAVTGAPALRVIDACITPVEGEDPD